MSRSDRSISASILLGNPVTVAGIAILVVLVALTLLSDWRPTYGLLAHYNPTALNFADANTPPSLAHLFGTDQEGRDIFARTLAALPIDMTIPLVIVGVSVLVGFVFGTFAGYLGGWVEEVTLRVADLFFAFPAIVFALAIAAILGQSSSQDLRVVYSEVALIIVGWPIYTRIARSQAISLKQMAFVKAAEASGIGRLGIIRKHVVPHLLPVIVAYATLDMGTTIIFYSIFAFFGLGVAPPTPELGRMVYEGLNVLPGNWWWSVFPGLVLMLMALSFSLIGEGLRDVLDPRLRGQR